MKKLESFVGRQSQQRLRMVGLILAVVAVVVGVRIVVAGKRTGPAMAVAAGAGHEGAKAGKASGEAATVRDSGKIEELVVSGRQPFTQSIAGTSRQPLQFRSKPVEPAAVLGVLATGKPTVDERVRQLQGMHGILFSKEDRESALAFLRGREVPEGMGKSSMHWLADELLTTLRLQEPPWDGLAEELANAAFQPGTDPVVRDYIMQHLGHLWEQSGARKEIDAALWRAVASSDGTTPGTALIALSRGYERDQQEENLAKVRQQALVLAQDANTPLAVRVTALSIAEDGGGAEVKKLADALLQNPKTPVILRKVAARAAK